MRILTWLFRGLIFFALFAFALNNQQDASVRGFFGTEWRAPMVIVVLAAFAAGCAVGVIATVPAWWRRRRAAPAPSAPAPEAAPATPAAGPPELPAAAAAHAAAFPPREIWPKRESR